MIQVAVGALAHVEETASQDVKDALLPVLPLVELIVEVAALVAAPVVVDVPQDVQIPV